MERRNALKLIGCLVGVMGGQAMLEKTSADEWWKVKPTEFIFEEKGISKIVFIRNNGEKFSVGFSEILDVLQDADKEG